MKPIQQPSAALQKHTISYFEPQLTVLVNQYMNQGVTFREGGMKTQRILLKALSAEMDLAFRGPTLEIHEFPFKIGRECRDRRSRLPPPGMIERRQGVTPRNNDLYIIESGSRLYVSRQHLLLEIRKTGLFLVDLFSSCGTIVEGQYIGADHKGGETMLNSNDIVIIGTANSPYLFKVMVD